MTGLLARVAIYLASSMMTAYGAGILGLAAIMLTDALSCGPRACFVDEPELDAQDRRELLRIGASFLLLGLVTFGLGIAGFTLPETADRYEVSLRGETSAAGVVER